jgi:hypothetical protein
MRFDLARVGFWLILTPVAFFAGWLSNVAFVSLISLWALVETAWAAYRAESTKQIDAVEGKLDKIMEELGVE